MTEHEQRLAEIRARLRDSMLCSERECISNFWNFNTGRQYPCPHRQEFLAEAVPDLLAHIDDLTATVLTYQADIPELERRAGQAEQREAAWRDYADRVSTFLVQLTPTVGHIVTSPLLREFDDLDRQFTAARAGEVQGA